MNFYQEIKERFSRLIPDDALWSSTVNVINIRPLTPQEVIGKPDRDDFPLLKGKEVMIQADFKGSLGQAFTDMPGNFKGSLREIFQLPLTSNFERAVFISTINAVLRYLGYIKILFIVKTRSLKCASLIKDYILEKNMV